MFALSLTPGTLPPAAHAAPRSAHPPCAPPASSLRTPRRQQQQQHHHHHHHHLQRVHAAPPSEQGQQQQPEAAQPQQVFYPSLDPPAGKHFIHVIEQNGKGAGRAFNGIPPVMGAHLMASGAIAPLSSSKGPGLDVEPHQFQYPSTEGAADLVQHSSADQLRASLAQHVLGAAAAAIAQRGAFTLVLSGGSLPSLLTGLADPGVAVAAAFDKWHVAYVDERNVPHDSPDSTHRAAVEALLGKVPIPAAHVVAIAEHVPVAQAATNYEGRLIGLPPAVLPRDAATGLPVFDLILLGLGPDGHVASLFPNHPAVAVTDRWVTSISNSPKPPPERITMTLPVINAAKEVVIVAAGEGKAEIVQRVLEVQSLPGALPAQLVRPASGKLSWFVDDGSTKELRVPTWEDKKAHPRST